MIDWRTLWVNRQCEICEEELFEDGLFCHECNEEIHRLVYPVVTQTEGYFLMSIYHYDGIIRELIHRMKFQEGRYVSRFFSAEMVRFLRANDISPQGVSYIPMHKKKKRKRGFDQAKDLCVEVSGQLGVSSASLLTRAKATRALYSLSAKERMHELEGAFTASIREDEQLWLVIDDILTTGSTIREASKTLRKAKIPNVLFLVIAR